MLGNMLEINHTLKMVSPECLQLTSVDARPALITQAILTRCCVFMYQKSHMNPLYDI